ncbi:MAG: transglutaminase-like domain-containing protein [Candidatus Micrarchaeota archaeon]
MRCGFLVLLLILALSNASSFGYSRITLHRTWEVTGSGPFDFTGALAVNDSSQRVVSITTEPEMERYVDDNGTIMLRYQGNGSVTLKADAIVDINYDPIISSDPAVPNKPLNSTPLTQADEQIAMKAGELSSDDSALKTIRNLVNFVHDYVEYDISYWGKSKSAQEVFQEKHGVCVEYTHLLIAMARSLGFQTRYVSGYVYSNAWQPHAWAEIYLPGHGWIATDATFAQAGVLDSTHLAIRKSDDQSASYDLLLSSDPAIDISAQDSLEIGFTSEDPKGVSLELDIDDQTYVTEVSLSNNRSDYVLGSYDLAMPDSYGGEQLSVMLLRPNEKLRLYHGMNYSLFDDGFFYTIPVSASFNDAHDEKTLTVDRFSPLGSSNSGNESSGSGCATGFIPVILATAAIGIWKIR